MGRSDIASVRGWEILDSRGRPTVACEVVLEDGTTGSASVPSGASTGRHEARELRDGGARYAGFGVRRAVASVGDELAQAVRGKDSTDQRGVDTSLVAADGTTDLNRLGSNAILAVSVAVATAGARVRGLPLYACLLGPDQTPLLPLPMVNIVSGGAHAGRSIDVQDVLVVPVGAGSFSEALEWAARVRTATADIFHDLGFASALVADEGGLAADLPTNRAALELVSAGIERAGLAPGVQVGIAIDVAATQLVQPDGNYRLETEARTLSPDELLAELAGWCRDFSVVSLEDPLAEDEWDGWSRATTALGPTQLLADDLLVTDTGRLRRAIGARIASAILVKPNQCGTLSAARDALDEARGAGYATVMSARSGETEDSWLADLAVGWRSGQIKVGSTMRSERTAKWNRLLAIEAAAGDGQNYAGSAALRTAVDVHGQGSPRFGSHSTGRRSSRESPPVGWR
jgi:enolase 1/2/3